MDPKLQTSFIPKKPMVAETRAKTGISLFFLISLIVFLTSLALGAAVYLGQKQLITNLEKDRALLARNQDAFEPLTIETLTRLDRRIEASKRLLEQHVTVSPVFALLEEKTLQTVRFRSFSFTTTPAGIVLAMAGQARNFSSVALQSDVLGSSPFLKNTIVADLNLTSDGSVSFGFRSMIDQKLVLYKSLLGITAN
jgi:hypothetical protein